MVDDLFGNKFSVKNNLDELKKRLEIGMKLKGRIIDCPKENRYILRIWGYNIYTDSKKKFEKSEEINIKVKEINPELVFDLEKIKNNKVSENHTNIVV